jgi:hypothetical protein
MTDVMQIVVIRVLSHSAIEIGPSQDVLFNILFSSIGKLESKVAYHCILFVFNRLNRNFS